MISKWAQRFYENIDPCPGEMGFDGLGNLETKTENKVKINNECSKEDKECMRLGFRMDELKDRISHHAGSPATLSWNKNVQCPPKTWDKLLSGKGKVIYTECKANTGKRICVKWYNTQTYTFVFCFCEDPKLKAWNPGDDPNRRAWESTSNQKSLILPRHDPYEKSLEIADYVSSYFPPRWPDAILAYEGNTKQEPNRNYGFWLIDEKDADFVYAILKSSMFRSWCELTANTDGKGEGHFTVGMWDTFPIQDIKKPLSQLENPSPELSEFLKTCPLKTLTVEEAIKRAGQRRKKGWKQSVFDKCMDELCGFGRIPKNYSRKQILAKGFLGMFSSLKTDVMSLA